MIHPFLQQKVTIRKMSRDARGNLAVSDTFENVPALLQGGQETTVDSGGQQMVTSAVVFLAPDAPIDAAHRDWRIVHDDEELDVIWIEKAMNHATGMVNHIKCLTGPLKGRARVRT